MATDRPPEALAGGGGRPMIELREVAKRYGAAFAAGPLNLTIAKGEFVALLGGSGSGKTTTLKMINGLVVPDAGEVRIDGRAASDEPAHSLRRRIGYVFQEVGLFPHMSVAENIAVGPRLAGWEKARTAERCGALLEPRRPAGERRGRGSPRRSREDSGSGSAWPGRWRPSRRSCSWTSRSVRSIR